jgi:hypothetical protein
MPKTTNDDTTEYAWLDRSGTCIIVRCRTCTFWHGFALDTVEGWEVATRHEHSVHPGVHHADRRLFDATRRAGRS